MSSTLGITRVLHSRTGSLHSIVRDAGASGVSSDTGQLDGSTGTDRVTKTDDGYMLDTTGISKAAAEDESLLARQRAASGSRLPDCGHACGACSPCRRVMVSFVCAQGASESCPIAYRCMCHGRFFRVPSL